MAMRNHPRISAATKARIARLAQKHKYVVDGRVTELMRSIRQHAEGEPTSSVGLISLYPEARPWANRERYGHLARLHRSMIKRAGELGYRVEEFWVRNPEMSMARLATIIETRGIRGLLSLGAPELEDEIPSELQRFVIVTQGASIRTKLHRVGSHFAHNASLLMEQLKARGYQRPGAVLQEFQDGRNAHVMAAMYLYYSKYVFGGADLPIFYARTSVDQRELKTWYEAHRPDVVIYADHRKHYPSLQAFFRSQRISIPRDLGLAVLDAAAHPPGISGVRQAVEQMGLSAVDMLVSRLHQGESGLPRVAKIEKVEGDWVEGSTLRAIVAQPSLVPV